MPVGDGLRGGERRLPLWCSLTLWTPSHKRGTEGSKLKKVTLLKLLPLQSAKDLLKRVDSVGLPSCVIIIEANVHQHPNAVIILGDEEYEDGGHMLSLSQYIFSFLIE